MKKALILYWHGLGDVIMLTPHLRYLYKQGYKTDLMCRPEVRISKLLDECPYIGKLIDVPNPWQSKLGNRHQRKINIQEFEDLRESYDWSSASPHSLLRFMRHKIDVTSAELELKLEDRELELFISQNAEAEAKKHMDDDYIFVQTVLEWHKYHDWDAREWIRGNLPPIKIMDFGYEKAYHMAFDDINVAFVIAREAKHRVLSSGIFVHACEAMHCKIDVINYGRLDRKIWPLDQSKVLHIRENGEWIK